MKTCLGICNRKKRFTSREEAEETARGAPFKLRAYRCELCRQFHLTSRTKGKKTPRHEIEGGSRTQKTTLNLSASICDFASLRSE